MFKVLGVKSQWCCMKGFCETSWIISHILRKLLSHVKQGEIAVGWGKF